MSVEALSDPVELFISSLYSNLLSRLPDEEGLEDWKELLTSGQYTAAKIVSGFVKSDEFQSTQRTDADYIATLYRAILEREANEDDIAAWKKVIDNGATRMKVLAGLLGSREFNSMCERFGIEAGEFKSKEYLDINHNVSAFIARLYLNCLDRVYDDESLLTWVKAIVDGTNTGTDAARGFFNSDELAARNLSNSDFVSICYRALLNREGSADEVNGWVKSIEGGMSRHDVVESFLWSKEFENFCGTYGIKISEKPKPAKTEDESEDESGWVSLGTFKITAYCPCSKCNGNSSGITYSGTHLTVGRTVAVSRSVIKMGSRLKIEGVGERIAEDTGVSGKTIDLLVSSHSKAYEWGVRYRQVWIKK